MKRKPFTPNKEDEYKCKECKEYFRLWNTYKAHMKKVHFKDIGKKNE